MKRILQIMLVMIMSWGASAQGVVIGRVTSQSGESIPGVNVLLKGTTDGTITDTNGNYRLTTSDGVLVFSFIGFKTQEVAIGGRSVVDVVMEEDVTTLEQVVVVGYGTQKKKDITSSVALVDESALKDRPMVSAAEALQGKAAGVQVVQNSGEPGTGLSIRVRGSTSIEAGNEPLYVVDGIQMTDIRGLNPSDISSISVLKDASSASIYGARAANGVVLITTKRGKSSAAPVVRFDSYLGFSKLRKTIDVLNTEQYKDLMAEIPSVGALDPSITNYTDWNEEVFGTGVVQNYQLSFSGGTEKTQYLLSGAYLKNEGMVAPAVFDRYSIRLNLDNQIKDWLKLGTNINFMRIKTEDTPDNLSSGRGGVIMSTLNTPPFLNVYKNDGSGQFDPNPFQPSWENPRAYMDGADQRDLETRLYGNVNLDIKLHQNLSFRSNLGVDLGYNQEDYYVDPFRTNYGRQEHGSGYANRYIYYSWIAENILTYSKTFNDHSVSVLGGTSTQHRVNDFSSISGSDFPNDVSVKTLNAANIESGYTTADEWKLVSFFGRVNYDYKGKYILAATIRRDGSSKLANPWGTMPSFSAGWRISSERFMENVKAINDLKLRFGWGRTGNQEGIPSYIKYGLVGYTRKEVTNPRSGPATYQMTMGNPDLKWETTDQSNIGIDVSFLDSRLNVNLDAYIKKTNDLIINVQLPQSVGLPNILTNAGDMENKGIELNISSVNIDKEITWTTDFNISLNRNKVTSINENLSSVYYYGRVYSNNQDVVIVKPGLALGTFYGYVADGVDSETGDLIYRDLDNNGLINADDRTVIGSGQPDFFYGFTNDLTYKRWRLNVFFQGSQGNDIYNATRVDLEGMFDSKNQSTVVLNRWTPSNTNTDIPRAGNIENVNNSTRFIENGSYLRLKAITLAYDLNPAMLERVGIRKFSVYTTGQNLLTFTNYSGFDPEVNAFGQSSTVLGVDYGTYPQARTIIFGINMEF